MSAAISDATETPLRTWASALQAFSTSYFPLEA